MGKLVVMTNKGDATLEWDPTDTKSTCRARDEFDRIIAANYGATLAYAPVKDQPGKHVQVKTFDPEAEEIVIRGPLVGG